MLRRLTTGWVLVMLAAPAAVAEADFIAPGPLHEAGLVKYWQLRLPLAEGQQVRDAYLVDDQIYVATADGDVFAVHAPTGVLRWRKRVTTAGYRIVRPCHAGDRTIFVLPPAVIQYDRYTGDPILRIEPRFPIGSPAISDGILYYVGGIDRKMHAFALDRDFELWKARAGGPIVSQPQRMGKYLYYASDNGNVYACVARNKAFYWRARTQGTITADLVVDKNGVYVAGRDNALYLFDPDAGGLRWLARFSSPLTEPPVVTDKVVFQYSPTDGVVALNTGIVDVNQRVRWTVPEARQLLTIEDERAILLSREERLLVVRLDDGQRVARVPAPGFTLPLPAPRQAAVFVASADGRLFCARSLGTPPLTVQEVRKALERPGTTGQEAESEKPKAAAKSGETGDILRSRRPGPPIGGKSKVSKKYAEEQATKK